MKKYAFIFARGGSKGIPRKNLVELGGKPLIAHSINTAQSISDIDKVFVSTEDKEIAYVAKLEGAEIIERPQDLASDDSPEWVSWKHAVEYVSKKFGEFDMFISLPTTSPLRAKQDVEACMSKLDGNADIIISVSPSHNNPYFNMVQIESSGAVALFNPSKERYTRRQDVPKAYNISTVTYVTSPEFIRKANGIFDGDVGAVEIPLERAVDIDNFFDLKIARCLIKDQKPYE